MEWQGNRRVEIEDEGDEITVGFFVGELQVGGAVFPVDVSGVDLAFDMVREVGRGFLLGGAP